MGWTPPGSLAGTHASRPAATALPAGTLWFSTDTSTLYRTDGTSWATVTSSSSGVRVEKAGTVVGTRGGINLIEGSGVTLTVTDDSANDEVDVTIAASGGGTAGLVLINRTVVGAGGAANVDVSSISAGYEDLVIVVHGRGTVAAQSAIVGVRFNNDSGATQYEWALVSGNTSTASSSGSTGASSLNIGRVTGTSAGAGQPASLVCEVPAYARTTFQKTVHSQSGYLMSGGRLIELYHGVWRSTAAINRVTLTPASGNFAEGTVASIYGRV